MLKRADWQALQFGAGAKPIQLVFSFAASRPYRAQEPNRRARKQKQG
jgi:hypothetical protein